MKKHSWWMMLACLGPLLLIFVLPAFGVSGSGLLLLVLIGCFALHLLMMGGHGHGGHGNGKGGQNGQD